MTRIPWRTLLLWGFPILAFAWLAVVARAGGESQAALPIKGSLLGGGSIGQKFVPRANYHLHFTTASVTGDGATVKFYGDWNGRCKGFSGPVTAAFFKQVEVADDGSFEGAGPLESTVASGRYEFEGRFWSGGRASGTGRVKFRFRPSASGPAYECDTGNVFWQVRTSGGVAGKPNPRAGRQYFGNTGQRLPVIARVSRNGRFVAQQAFLWNATCRKNTSGLGRGTSFPSVRIRSGRFAFTSRYTEVYGEFIAYITSTNRGVFGATSVGGTLRVRVDVRRASDRSRADSCDSGPIRWSARL